MDIVVVDIPPKYGMILSRSWGAKLQGSLQLDMSYATIYVFGQQRKLYKETLTKYMVSIVEKQQNSPYTPCIPIWTLSSCIIQTMTKMKSHL